MLMIIMENFAALGKQISLIAAETWAGNFEFHLHAKSVEALKLDSTQIMNVGIDPSKISRDSDENVGRSSATRQNSGSYNTDNSIPGD